MAIVVMIDVPIVAVPVAGVTTVPMPGVRITPAPNPGSIVISFASTLLTICSVIVSSDVSNVSEIAGFAATAQAQTPDHWWHGGAQRPADGGEVIDLAELATEVDLEAEPAAEHGQRIRPQSTGSPGVTSGR